MFATSLYFTSLRGYYCNHQPILLDVLCKEKMCRNVLMLKIAWTVKIRTTQMPAALRRTFFLNGLMAKNVAKVPQLMFWPLGDPLSFHRVLGLLSVCVLCIELGVLCDLAVVGDLWISPTQQLLCPSHPPLHVPHWPCSAWGTFWTISPRSVGEKREISQGLERCCFQE